MKHFLLMSAAALALAACAPSVPESGAPNPGTGVGFGNYNDYQQKQAAREAQLQGGLPAAQAVSQEPLTASGQTDVASETEAVLAATRPAGQTVVNASPSNPQPALVNAVGISKENDFDAVGSQRTIADDAARREALKAQYQQAAVEAVPTRSGGKSADIVDYALNTSNPVGRSMYKRSPLNTAAKNQRNCAKYPSPDLAQAEFLAKGGPQRDRLALDIDGDGFACSWDPEPFRSAKTAREPEGVAIVEDTATE